MKTCIGLLIFFACPDDQPTVTSDFCQLAGPEIQRLRMLSESEARALKSQRLAAIRNLKQLQNRLCNSNSPMKNR